MQAERPNRRRRAAVAATIVAAAAVLTFRLLVPPIVGLADNGDFERFLRPAGLAYATDRPEERFFGWMQPRFRYVPSAPDSSGYRSSEGLLVEVAVRASRSLSRAPFFDVRFLGVLHALLLCAALGGLVAACRDLALPAQAAAAALSVFFFTDPGYVAPFNSLYSQTASFLFLLLTAAAAALAVRNGRLSGGLLAAYFLAAALFVCGKPQEVVHAPILGLLGARLAWPGSRAGRRALAVTLALALCALAARYYRSAERSLGWITRYNVIFMVILPGSPDPAADLAEMGLDPSLARYRGVSAWAPESPASDPTFRALIHRSSPRAFLLRHPRQLGPLLGAAVDASYRLRPEYLGNFSKESGRPAGARAPAPWSEARVVLGHLPWLAALLGGTFAVAAWTHRRAPPRGRLLREVLCATCLMAVGAFVVAVAGDTHRELARHLYTFQALCDLILAADAAWIVQALSVRGWTNHRIAVAAVAAAGAFLASQLLARPVVGLADNGDFERVMSAVGLTHVASSPEDRYFNWIPAKLARAEPGWSPTAHPSSESFLAAAAVAAARPFSPGRVLDLRWFGALHGLLLLAALGLMVTAADRLELPAQATAALSLALIFTDVAYTAPLNSLYAQAASFLFLMLAAGFAARFIGKASPSLTMLAGYFVAAALFVCSRPQEAIHAPLLALFGSRLSLDAFPRRRALAAALALGLCAVATVYFLRVPRWVGRSALYHAVFYELLPHSPDPARDLAELRLAPDLGRYSGTTAYSPNTGYWTPRVQRALDDSIGYGRLARFYAAHPLRAMAVLGRAARAAARMRPPRFGNFPKEEGGPPREASRRFALWSDLRFALRSLSIAWPAGILGGTLAACLAGWRRSGRWSRLARKGLAALCLVAIVEFLVCAFADAHIELIRHLYVYFAALDLVLVADAAWIVQILASRRASRAVAPVAAAA